MTFKRMLVNVAVTTCFAIPGISLAADWPTRPVTVVIPYPAGGAADVVARILTNDLAQEFGQAFIAEPKPGANSNIAADAVARAAPDGYTLLITGPWFAINQYVETGRNWDPASLRPVARFAQTDNMLTVPVSSEAKTLAEYVNLAKTKQDTTPLQYGSPGTGSTQRMAAELFLSEAGIKVDSVQYKGAPPIIPDLVSGRVSMAVLAAGNVTALVESGKLRGLATFGPTRGFNTPNIPTMTELGYPKAVVTSWFGLHAPAATPDNIISKLSDTIAKVMQKPEIQQALRAATAQEAYLNAQAFGDFIREEEALWQAVAPKLGEEK